MKRSSASASAITAFSTAVAAVISFGSLALIYTKDVTVKLLPFFMPGDPAMGEAVRGLAGRRTAVMLANQLGGRIRGQALPVRVGRRITVVRTVVLGDGDKPLAEVTTTHVPA